MEEVAHFILASFGNCLKQDDWQLILSMLTECGLLLWQLWDVIFLLRHLDYLG
jgi:hypothetical protein